MSALLALAACVGDDPPTEKDVLGLYVKQLAAENAQGTWKPVDVKVLNLKCDKDGSVYACKFDANGKLQRQNPFTNRIEVHEFSRQGLVSRYIKTGETWDLTL